MSSYLRVLRFHNFRYLFLGQSASAVGDQAVIVALALYVTQRTGSATDLGFVLAAQALPMIVLLLFGGVWADRLPRQRIMIVSDVVRAALHGALAASILTGGASVAELVVIEALFGAARAFFQPAYTGLLPETVDGPLLQDAQALSKTTANLSILVGPALGTAIVLSAGAGVAFALDAATFVISAALLGFVRFGPRPRAPAPSPVGEGAVSLLAELRAGWQEVRSRPWVWATIAAFTGAMLCGYAPWYALAPGIARDVYGGASRFGVLESVAGGGALLGAVLGARWRPARPLVVGTLLGLAWPAQSIAFALGAPLEIVIVLAFAAGVGFALFEIWWETALARNIPPGALSRVSSYDWMGSLALLPLGFAISGPVAAVLGARPVLGVGAGLSALMLVLVLVPRSTRNLPGEGRAARAGAVASPAPESGLAASGEPRAPR